MRALRSPGRLFRHEQRQPGADAEVPPLGRSGCRDSPRQDRRERAVYRMDRAHPRDRDRTGQRTSPGHPIPRPRSRVMTHDVSAVRRRTGHVATVILVLLGAAAWFPYSSARAATLAVTTSSLPAAHQANAYSATLTADGGAAPYHWSVSGSLPAGLSLSSAGLIHGTPTTADTATVTVTVSDSAAPTAASATKTLTLAVLAPPNQSMVYVLNDRPDVTEYAPGQSE